jgi:osmotically inducible protein OsmC
MNMVVRTSAAQWNGRVQDGSGSVSLGSGAFEGPYSFGSRFGVEAGTNPEELLAAAHASCFSMALSLLLTEAGYTPGRIETQAKVRIERVGNGFAITHIQLSTEGEFPGMDARTFAAHAEVARRSCPLSKALASVDIGLTATLLEGPGRVASQGPETARTAPPARAPVMSRRGSERFQRAP